MHEHCPSPRGIRAARRRGHPRYGLGGGAARPPGRWALRRAVERTANQANRSVVGGHAYPLVTVRGAEPNKAGQPGCLVLLRQRADGPWMLFAAVITETAVIWDGGVTGVRYGTDSPTGDVNDTPTRCSSRMGALRFGDLGLAVRL
jgi:hypothetical protein